MSEIGRLGCGQHGRSDILQRGSNEMFRPEAYESVFGTILVGKMLESRLLQASTSQRQFTILIHTCTYVLKLNKSSSGMISKFKLSETILVQKNDEYTCVI